MSMAQIDIFNAMEEETLSQITSIYQFWDRGILLTKYQFNRIAMDGGWENLLILIRHLPYEKSSPEYISILSYVIEILRSFKVDNLIPRVMMAASLHVEDINTPPLLYAAWVTYGNDDRVRDKLSLTTNRIMSRNLPLKAWRGYIPPQIDQYENYQPINQWIDIDVIDAMHEEGVITPSMIKDIQRILTMNGYPIPISSISPGNNESTGINPVILEHTYQWWNVHNEEKISEIIYNVYSNPAERLAIAYGLGIPITEGVILHQSLPSYDDII